MANKFLETRSKKNMQEELDSEYEDVDGYSLNSDTDYIENRSFEVLNTEQIENSEGPEHQETNTNNESIQFLVVN